MVYVHSHKWFLTLQNSSRTRVWFCQLCKPDQTRKVESVGILSSLEPTTKEVGSMVSSSKVNQPQGLLPTMASDQSFGYLFNFNFPKRLGMDKIFQQIWFEE